MGTVKRLTPVVWKVKLEFGELEVILKLSPLHSMDPALSGISSLTLELCASLNPPCSSKSFTTQMNLKFLPLVATERLLTGTALMVKQLECSMVQRPERLMPLLLPRMENTSFQVDKTRKSNFGITMKESATTTELAILEILPRFKFHLIKEP